MKKHKHPLSRAPLPELTSRLRQKSRKVTGQREAILDLLRKHPHPLTNKQICAALSRHSCNLATVYRSIHLLEAIGMVKRFDFGDGVARFELVGEIDPHHHHLICTQCSQIVEIEECFSSEFEERIAAANGFKAVTHKLEFFGICPQCHAA